jgi:hypothetical protein
MCKQFGILKDKEYLLTIKGILILYGNYINYPWIKRHLNSAKIEIHKEMCNMPIGKTFEYYLHSEVRKQILLHFPQHETVMTDILSILPPLDFQ